MLREKRSQVPYCHLRSVTINAPHSLVLVRCHLAIMSVCTRTYLPSSPSPPPAHVQFCDLAFLEDVQCSLTDRTPLPWVGGVSRCAVCSPQPAAHAAIAVGSPLSFLLCFSHFFFSPLHQSFPTFEAEAVLFSARDRERETPTTNIKALTGSINPSWFG